MPSAVEELVYAAKLGLLWRLAAALCCIFPCSYAFSHVVVSPVACRVVMDADWSSTCSHSPVLPFHIGIWERLPRQVSLHTEIHTRCKPVMQVLQQDQAPQRQECQTNSDEVCLVRKQGQYHRAVDSGWCPQCSNHVEYLGWSNAEFSALKTTFTYQNN